MTNKEKKNKIADILFEFYEEYNGNMPNRPMIPSIYADKIINSLQEEPVSEELTDEIKSWLKQWSENKMEWSCEDIWDTAEHFANWKKQHLWKPADGDELPDIDIEVIALLDNGKVVFAHRPDPKGWDGKSLTSGKVEHYTPKTYGKGGWNIPNIVYWLDVDLPKLED